MTALNLHFSGGKKIDILRKIDEPFEPSKEQWQLLEQLREENKVLKIECENLKNKNQQVECRIYEEFDAKFVQLKNFIIDKIDAFIKIKKLEELEKIPAKDIFDSAVGDSSQLTFL